MSKQEFYRNCYFNTGWLPMQPLTRTLAVGDIGQIYQGHFQLLLNIEGAHLEEKLSQSDEIALDSADWRISQGAHQSFNEAQAIQSQDGAHLYRTKQVLEFAHAQDFIFHVQAPSVKLLLNWDQIRDDLTVKLTQLHYSFREAYVVTGVATSSDWGLAIAGQDNAQLEMSAAIENSDRFSLLSHNSSKADISKDIACYEVARGQTAYFFKAKKLVMSDAMVDQYLAQVVANKAGLNPGEVANWLHADLLNKVKTDELNLSTCLDFFTWVDMSLDDIERLGG